MKAIEKIEEVIENLQNKKSDEIVLEEQEITSKIALIDGFIHAANNAEDFLVYNYDEAIKLLSEYNHDADKINKLIRDIKNVIVVKTKLGIEYDIELDESQIEDFKNIIANLEQIKKDLQTRKEEISSLKINQNESKISELVALKSILEGKGRRRFYTKNMINTFMNEIDIQQMNSNEAFELLNDFFVTRNMDISNVYNKKQGEPEDFDEIVDLYKKYVPEYFEKVILKEGVEELSIFERDLISRKNYIIYEIDLDNTREVLDWLKERGLLRKFDKRALIEIASYGTVSMLETAYKSLELNNNYFGNKVYSHKYSVFWTKYDEQKKILRMKRMQTRRHNPEGIKPKNQLPDVSGKQMITNKRIFDQLIREGIIDSDALKDEEAFIFVPSWMIEKNIRLTKIFGIGENLSSIPVRYFYAKDEEKAINAAIELGLFHPPMDNESKSIDSRLPGNERFKESNQTIRDYFSRYISTLTLLSDDKIRYLSYIIETEGYETLYKYLLSEKRIGTADWNAIDDMREATRESDMLDKLYSLNDYPEYISNYYEIDETVNEYELELKNNYEDYYINDKILDNELIIELEEKYRVENEYNDNGEEIIRPSSYLYNFNGKLISRKKTLHIATILYDLYGYLNRDMILYAITKDSFFNKENFEKIVEMIKGKENVKRI